VTTPPTAETAAPAAVGTGPTVRRRPPEPGAPHNPVEEVILTRRSVRNFRDRPVPEYLVRRILEAGRFAPSAGNNQSWRFVVVRDPRLIAEMTVHVQTWAQRLSKLIDPTYPGAWVPRWWARLLQRLFVRLVPASMHPTGLAGLGQLALGELGVWHGAPTVIMLLSDTRGTGKPLLDLGIAGQNMSLTAHSMGLGSCWVSFAMFLQLSPRFRRELGIARPYKLITSLAIGWPVGQPDGYVERETQEVLWIEDDGTRGVRT
jgi:nitroreductase